jgi:large subunit ribosomal protein L35
VENRLISIRKTRYNPSFIVIWLELIGCLDHILLNSFKEIEMPKMKTKSSAKKRFSISASGKVKFKPANKVHRLMQKTKSAKRKAKGNATMERGDAAKVVKSFMPYCRAKKTTTKKAEPIQAQGDK